jgi:hypothetical protein
MLLCAPNKDYMNYIKRRSVCEQYIPVYVYPKGKKKYTKCIHVPVSIQSKIN